MRSLMLLTLTVFILSSCLKQDPPALKSEIFQTQRDKAQLKKCGDFQLFNNQLSKENTLKLFECNQWDERFSALYNSIRETSAQDWENVFRPIDEKFFNDISGRKKFIGVFKKLKDDNQLDSLGKISEQFFSRDLLNIVSNPMYKDDLSNLLGFLNSSNQNKEQLVNAIKILNKVLHENKNFGKVIHPILVNKNLSELKIWLIDYFSKRFRARDNKVEVNYFSKMFSSKEKNSWFPQWVTTKETKESHIKYLFDYTANMRPELYQDAIFLKDVLNNGFDCINIKKPVYFDIRPEIKNCIDDLVVNSQEEYFSAQLDHETKLLAFENLCSQITISDVVKPQMIPTFKRLFSNLSEFMDNETNYLFLQGLHKTAIEVSGPFYIIDFLSSEYFLNLTKIVQTLKKDNQENFYELLTTVFKSLGSKDYDLISKMFSQVSEDEELNLFLANVSSFWLKLSPLEKSNVVNFVTDLLTPENNLDSLSSSSLDMILLIANDWEYWNESYFKNVQVVDSLQRIANNFSSENSKNELKSYFGKDHMMKVISVVLNGFSAENLGFVNNDLLNSQEPLISYVLNSDSRYLDGYKNCINELVKKNSEGTTYYQFLENYPRVCMSVKNGPILHEMFRWFNEINIDYQKEFGDGSLLFNHQGILQKKSLDQILQVIEAIGVAKPNSSIDIFKSIHKHIILDNNYLLYETVLLFVAEFYKNLSQDVRPYYEESIKTLIEIDDSTYKYLIKGIPELILQFKDASRPPRKLVTHLNCRDLDPNFGVNPCLSKEEIKKSVKRLIQIVERKFEGSPGILEEFIALFHSDSDYFIPFQKRDKFRKKYHITFEEIIRFFYHMSDKNDLHPLVFKTPTGEYKKDVDTLTHVETVIREISFLNNFYGLYFQNEVASANDYQDKVNKLESQVKLMNKLGGLGRGVHLFPKESKEMLPNVLSSYYGLKHVADSFSFEGKNYSYGNMMQAILTLTVKTSKKKVQNYTPYWIPNLEFTDVHNGEFLLDFVNLSGMRHLAQFIRNRNGDGPSKLFQKDSFKRLNEKFFQKISLNTWQKSLRELFNQYAKDNNNTVSIMVDDFIDFIHELSEEELIYLEDLIYNSMVFTTYLDGNLDSMMKLLKDLPLLYSEYKKNWPTNVSFKSIIKDLSKVSEILVTKLENKEIDPKLVNEVYKVIKAVISNDKFSDFVPIFKMLNKNPKFWANNSNELIKYLKSFNESLSVEDILSLQKVLTDLIDTDGLTFEGLKAWIGSSLDEGPHHDETLKLGQYLTKKVEYSGKPRSRFYILIDKFIGEKKEELSKLIDTVSKIIELK